MVIMNDELGNLYLVLGLEHSHGLFKDNKIPQLG
jgi:hypothetical protein